LLDLPVLYLSKYIIENKADYYRLLRAVTENADWQQWVLYMLKGVVETAGYTLEKIKNILALKDLTAQQIKAALGSSFSKELVALLFSYPYIKISVLTTYGIAKRQTASQNLQKIENLGVLQSIKIGRETYYINHQLMQLLSG
jgi:Fic family protein